MYAEKVLDTNSGVAGSDIKKGVAVTLNSTGKIVPAANNKKTLGVSTKAVKSGKVASYALNGSLINAVADGSGTAIAIGDNVGPGADDGTLVKKTLATDSVVGTARSATSSSAGTIFLEVNINSLGTLTI